MAPRRKSRRWKKKELRTEHEKAYQSKNKLAIYCYRNKLLIEMGYASYSDYLASDLWKQLASKAVMANGHRCIACGGRATQVHHTAYDRATLQGDAPKNLLPVCRPCHGMAERTDSGEKRSLLEANALIRNTTPNKKSKKSKKSKKQQAPHTVAAKAPLPTAEYATNNTAVLGMYCILDQRGQPVRANHRGNYPIGSSLLFRSKRAARRTAGAMNKKYAHQFAPAILMQA